MDAIIHFLINWGYWGMLIAGFLSGSIFPLSSEAVLLGLDAAGLHPIPLVVYGSIGNIAGSLLNYRIGRMGRLDWIEKYLHVKMESIDKAVRFMNGGGAWMGFFSFLPVIGEGITIALGLMRANILITTVSISIGKIIRYLILAWSLSFFF